MYPPYRLVDQQDQELAWANAFLDAQRLRQLSLRSLRAYGFDLLHSFFSFCVGGPTHSVWLSAGLYFDP